MSTLDATRAELALVILYLNKPKAREKICKAIQYGLKFWSDGQPGTAQNVDKSTSLARKVFHLFKPVNDLHDLICPAPQGTPLPLILLGKRIGWKLVYVDHENHVLLVGDDPWEEFVNWVHCIKILYPQEVQQMRLDGDIGNSLLQKEVCNSVLLVSHG